MDEGIDSFTVDALKEISNIAAGHLSEVISQLTKKEMSISVPGARISKVEEIAEEMGGKGAMILVGYVNVFGDVTGSMAILLSKKNALKMAEITLNSKIDPLMFPNQIEKDAIRELFTIASGAYLNAVTQYLEIFFVPTSPVISLFGAFNLLNFLQTRAGSMEEYETRSIVTVSIHYSVEGTDADGEIRILVGPTILDYLKTEIKKKQK